MTNADSILHGLQLVLLSAAGFGCFYTLMTAALVRRFRTRNPHEVCPPAAVSILVPLCGLEPGLGDRLRRLCDQDYGAPVQVVCGVRDPADPAVAVVREIATEATARDITLVVDPRVHGANLKVSNLINMMPSARHDIIVMIDSDIAVAPCFLTVIHRELQHPGIGAVTCFYYGIAGAGLWSRLMAMGITLNFLPTIVQAVSQGMSRPCFGATIALTRDRLEAIGGFSAYVDQLWDDYAIGEAIRKRGELVRLSSMAVGHVCTDESARDVFSRELRNARTIRGINPIGHVGAIVTYPFALAVLAMLVGAVTGGALLALAAFACRLVLVHCVRRRFGAPPQPLWLIPLRDLAAFAVHVVSLFGTTIVWRGKRYRVRANGTLVPAMK